MSMTTVWRLLIEHPEIVAPWMEKNKRLGMGYGEGEIGDLRLFGSRQAMEVAILARNAHNPQHMHRAAANARLGSFSLWDFCYKMKPGDLVIIGDGTQRLKVWEVGGDYEYVVDPLAFPLNYQHQRKARTVDRNPDVLWRQAGRKLLKGQINYRTLGQCANGIP
jgi:hypothetical protein